MYQPSIYEGFHNNHVVNFHGKFSDEEMKDTVLFTWEELEELYPEDDQEENQKDEMSSEIDNESSNKKGS